MSQIKSSVLLIAFNRPDTTQRVFDCIRKSKPSKLYFSVDGPRKNCIEDEANVSKVKQIVYQVDWDCDVYTKFNDFNLGCGPGPASAISWVFETEDRAIILEDDCVPAQPFFPYCDELLERYKNDTRIWLISGNNYNEEAVTTPHSYFFSKYGHSWGWATWKRCWQEMDLKMRKWPLIIEQDLLKSAFQTKKEYRFFARKLNRVYQDHSAMSHIWDFQFMFTLKSNDALTIVPIKNLVSNIGYIGTHNEKKNRFHDRAVDESFKIVSHPDFILCDVNYDKYHFNNHWNSKKDIPMKIAKKMRKILKEFTGK